MVTAAQMQEQLAGLPSYRPVVVVIEEPISVVDDNGETVHLESPNSPALSADVVTVRDTGSAIELLVGEDPDSLDWRLPLDYSGDSDWAVAHALHELREQLSYALTHRPCCYLHNREMTCERYRRIHFVKVGPCCDVWAVLHPTTPRSPEGEEPLPHRPREVPSDGTPSVADGRPSPSGGTTTSTADREESR